MHRENNAINAKICHWLTDEVTPRICFKDSLKVNYVVLIKDKFKFRKISNINKLTYLYDGQYSNNWINKLSSARNEV